MLSVRNFVTGEKMDIVDAMRGGVIVMTSSVDDSLERDEELCTKIIPKAKTLKSNSNLMIYLFCVYACLSIVSLIFLRLGYRNVFTNTVFWASASIVTLSAIAYVVLLIIKFLWEKELKKRGITIPKKLN